MHTTDRSRQEAERDAQSFRSFSKEALKYVGRGLRSAQWIGRNVQYPAGGGIAHVCQRRTCGLPSPDGARYARLDVHVCVHAADRLKHAHRNTRICERSRSSDLCEWISWRYSSRSILVGYERANTSALSPRTRGCEENLLKGCEVARRSGYVGVARFVC